MNRRIVGFLLGGLLVSAVAFSSCRQKSPPPSSAPAPPPPRPKGVQLLSSPKWEYSADARATWTSTFPSPGFGQTEPVIARTRFSVPEPGAFVALELHLPQGGWATEFSLNGEPLKGPLAKMYYRPLPAIPAELLQAGDNVLEGQATGSYITEDAFDVSLYGLRPADLEIRTGPILGAAGADSFSVTCRTNLFVPVELTVTQDSPAATAPVVTSRQSTLAGLMHRFRLRGLEARTACRYTLSATCRDIRVTVGPFPVTFLPPSGPSLRFVAMGDCRSYPDTWRQVAAAAAKTRPELVAFSGDMVSYGQFDWMWDEEFWAPAKELLAGVPFYPVPGNHDERGPLYDELFATPSDGDMDRSWSQQVRDVLLIGIDGAQDWTAGSPYAAWLEKTLSQSRAKFIFLLSHYPAWTSGRYGWVDPGASPHDDYVIMARKAVVPLLRKYAATAMIAGHDHDYERSELPEDPKAETPEGRAALTVIVSGGAGAPLRERYEEAAANNPYSKVFTAQHHFCLLEIEGDTCTLKVLTPDGTTLDTRAWQARRLPASGPAP